MFGFGGEFNRGVQAQQSVETLRGLRTQRDEARVMAEWETALQNARTDAATAQAALNQAKAETTAARAQLHVSLNMLDKLSEALRAADPDNPLCNDLLRQQSMRTQTDLELMSVGLRLIRRTGQPHEVVPY